MNPSKKVAQGAHNWTTRVLFPGGAESRFNFKTGSFVCLASVAIIAAGQIIDGGNPETGSSSANGKFSKESSDLSDEAGSMGSRVLGTTMSMSSTLVLLPTASTAGPDHVGCALVSWFRDVD